MIDLKVNMDIPFAIDTKSEEVKIKITKSLREYYRQYTKADIEIVITSITYDGTSRIVSRSLHVTTKKVEIDYTVIYKEDNAIVASELTLATVDLSNGAILYIGGHKINIKAVNVKSKKPCDVLEETVGKCAGGYKCEVENERPICRLSSSKTNLALIIGISCGVIILLLLTIIVIICLRQRNQGKKDDLKMQNEVTSASDLGKNLEHINTHRQNIYNVLNWKTVADLNDKADDSESSKYMTWKSIASRFTMASGSDAKDDGRFHIPRARMQAAAHSNSSYISPREYWKCEKNLQLTIIVT